MATRMQQRRGTAAQWTSANPILNVGEIGYETDTNQFKIGDGTNHWGDLSYFIDETALNTSLGDYIETSQLGVANGVATLNSSGKLESSQVPNIDELAQDAVDMALVAGTGISKTYNDNANTITIAVDTSVIATKAELAEVSQDSINDALTAGTGITKSYDDLLNTITLAVDTSVIATKAELAEVSQDSVNDALVAGTGLSKSYNDSSNTITFAIDSTVATLNGTQTLASKTISLANNTISGSLVDFNQALTDADFATISGTESLFNKTINAANNTIILSSSEVSDFEEKAVDVVANALNSGTHTNISVSYNDNAGTISLTAAPGYSDEQAQDAIGNSLGFGLSYNDSTGAISVDTATVQARVTDVSDAEIGYLANVTSDIQTQLNAKASLTDLSNHESDTTNIHGIANTAAIVFTTDSGTVTSTMIANGTIVDEDINASAAIAYSKLSLANSITSSDIADGTIVNADISGSASISQSKIKDLTTDLAAKANLSGATFTGSVEIDQDLTVDGNFIVNGSNVLVSATQIQIEDNILQLAHQNANNIVDLGIVAGYNDGTAKHAGLVKDISDSGKWKLFKGLTTEPSTTIDFTQATLDDLVVGGLEATSLTLGNVTNTEFSYLDGVTSGIQTQIDGKISSSSTDTLTNKTINLTNNTLSGTTAQFNTALSDGDFATLAGTETLTGKTINGANNTLTVRIANDVSGLGTGVASALSNNVGSANSFVINGGALGTPSSGTLTNATGLPISTGVSGLATGMATFLATPSSANLFATLTDDTGTGLVVFNSSPTIVTPRVQLAMNAQTGTTYTLALSDASSRWVTCSNAGSITVTVPPSVFSVGDVVTVQQTGAGQVTFAQGAGVTITSAGATSSAPKIRVQHASATIVCTASNTFTIVGDIV